MGADRFVSPAGVVVEMKPEAAARIGWKPEEKPKRSSRKAKSDD